MATSYQAGRMNGYSVNGLASGTSVDYSPYKSDFAHEYSCMEWRRDRSK